MYRPFGPYNYSTLEFDDEVAVADDGEHADGCDDDDDLCN